MSINQDPEAADTVQTTKPEAVDPAADCSHPWRVWMVENEFIAAVSLEEAIGYYCDMHGTERDEINFEDSDYDSGGFYRSGDEMDSWDKDPDCTLREAADEKIAEGERIPFGVAIAFNY